MKIVHRLIPATVSVCILLAPTFAVHAAVGIFEANQDVGAVLHPGSLEFDATKKSYTLAGSGENMWAAKDAFQFVWKKSAGDLTLTADISFIGESKEPHRKACLMIRQALDANSSYVDVALHGDGLTSLQFRDAKGAATHEVQANVKGPKRLRLEKQGKYVRMYLAGDDGELKYSGAATRITFEEPFYVGLGVCAHNKDMVEKATFSNVDIAPTDPTRKQRLFSSLETQVLASSDRRVVLVVPTRIEAARWLDNQNLTYLSGDLSFTIPAAGGKEREGGDAKSGPAAKGPDTNDEFNNWFPQTSPDGKRVVFLSYQKDVADHPADKDVTLRIMTLETKRIDILGRFLSGEGTINAPCWSPDGRRITFVSYQFIQ